MIKQVASPTGHAQPESFALRPSTVGNKVRERRHPKARGRLSLLALEIVCLRVTHYAIQSEPEGGRLAVLVILELCEGTRQRT